MWLGSWGGRVGVGIVGNYRDLEFLVQRYAPEATDVLFPYPNKLNPGRTAGCGQLLMTFTREGLRRAANMTERANDEVLSSRF
jgi:hypothetical protein